MERVDWEKVFTPDTPVLEIVTDEELTAEVRKAGCKDIAQVKSVFIESDGTISIIKEDKK